MTNFTTSSFLSVPSSSSSDSTMPSLSQTPLLEPALTLEPDCETTRRWAFFGNVMTDPSYALALDAHFCAAECYSVLNLITIYRAADFSLPYADHLMKALFGTSQEAASCIAYQQRKLRNLVLQTFDQMNLEPDFRQVERKVRSPLPPKLPFAFPATSHHPDTHSKERRNTGGSTYSGRNASPYQTAKPPNQEETRTLSFIRFTALSSIPRGGALFNFGDRARGSSC